MTGITYYEGQDLKRTPRIKKSHSIEWDFTFFDL
jgi:hypothetical protein